MAYSGDQQCLKLNKKNNQRCIAIIRFITMMLHKKCSLIIHAL